MKKDNRGISLVELIVTMAIAVIVGGAILGFIMTSSNQYRNANAEVNLQYEAQLAMNQIGDLLMNATNGVTYTEVSADERNLYVYNRNTDDAGAVSRVVTKIGWKSADAQLLYSTYNYVQNPDGSTSLTPIIEDQLMSDYITDFSADVSKLDSRSEVGVTLGLTIGSKAFDTDNTFTVRNDINKVATPDQAFDPDGTEELVATVTGVTVSPASVYQQQGTTGNAFQAVVIGTNYPIQDVMWSIPETTVLTDAYDEVTNPTGTRIDAGTGVVVLGAKETCETIEVQALSVQSKNTAGDDTSKYVAGSAFIHNKYMKNVQLADITATTDLTATSTVTLNGTNFESTDDYSDGLSFVFQDGNRIVTDVNWTKENIHAVGENSQSIRIEFTTTNEDYVGRALTVTAVYNTDECESASKRLTFQQKTVESIGIEIQDEDGNWTDYATNTRAVSRGETLKLRVRERYTSGAESYITSQDNDWKNIIWTTTQVGQTSPSSIYGDVATIGSSGTFTVKTSLSYGSDYSFEIHAKMEKLETKAKLKASKIGFSIDENQNETFPNGFPMLLGKKGKIHFTVTGAETSGNQFTVVCTNNNLGNKNRGWTIDIADDSKTATIKPVGNNDLGKITLTFSLRYGSTEVATTTIKVDSGSSNVGHYNSRRNWVDDKDYIPYVDGSHTYYLLDGTMVQIRTESYLWYQYHYMQMDGGRQYSYGSSYWYY